MDVSKENWDLGEKICKNSENSGVQLCAILCSEPDTSTYGRGNTNATCKYFGRSVMRKRKQIASMAEVSSSQMYHKEILD